MKTGTRNGLIFLAGLLVGLATGALSGLFLNEEGVPLSVPGTAEMEAGEGTEALLKLRAEIIEKDSEIRQLRRELEAIQATAVAPASGEEISAEELLRAAFQERMQERISNRTDNRVDELAERYGLNETQKAALRQALTDRFERIRAQRSGEDVEPFSLDAAMADILTEDQFKQYLQDSQEEIYNRADQLAINQVARLSQAIPMSRELEDMVYETINLTAQEMMIAQQEGRDYQMREVMEERLGSILSEEQMAIYREATRGGQRRGPGSGGRGP